MRAAIDVTSQQAQFFDKGRGLAEIAQDQMLDAALKIIIEFQYIISYTIYYILILIEFKESDISVEQIASNFMMTMSDPQKLITLINPNAMVGGGVLPEYIPATEAINIIFRLKAAFPDLNFGIQQVTLSGNTATMHTTWSGSRPDLSVCPSLARQQF